MKSKVSKIFNFSLFIIPLLSFISLFIHQPALTITLFTFSYHFFERMISGVISSYIKVKGISPYFKVREWELKLYRVIRIKEWKDYAPTYKPETFIVKDLNKLRESMLGSETCHILCFLFSYIPPIISLTVPYLKSTFIIFFITSFLSSIFDLLLIFIQRYNRNRVENILRKMPHLKQWSIAYSKYYQLFFFLSFLQPRSNYRIYDRHNRNNEENYCKRSLYKANRTCDHQRLDVVCLDKLTKYKTKYKWR